MTFRVLLFLLPMACATAAPAGWKLQWSDEFERNGQFEASKWSLCERGKSDWNNTMSDDRRCVTVRNGRLLLNGFVNQRKGKDEPPFLTGGLTSKGKFSFQHGRIEINARFKSAKGAWPALWLLGDKGGWPKNGEIDIMEHLNFEDSVYQTVHSGFTQHSNNPPKGGTAKIDKKGFNTYGVEWDTDKITFSVNDKTTFTYPRVADKGAEQWPFDQPFYIIMSMQIGGTWVGAADPKDYPSGMEVDWVRVYSKAD